MITSKTHKVVMLTTKKAPIALNQDELYLTQSELEYIKDEKIGTQPKHLYALSDDEIKEGDHYFDPELRISTSIAVRRSKDGDYRECKKIVATTDKSLGILEDCPVRGYGSSIKYILPQLPESFIQAYIKAYNEGKPITEVNLEYDKSFHGYFDQGGEDWRYTLKTRSDNTVIICQTKMYSREEVHTLMMQAWINGESKPNQHYSVREKWIEENL